MIRGVVCRLLRVLNALHGSPGAVRPHRIPASTRANERLKARTASGPRDASLDAAAQPAISGTAAALPSASPSVQSRNVAHCHHPALILLALAMPMTVSCGSKVSPEGILNNSSPTARPPSPPPSTSQPISTNSSAAAQKGTVAEIVARPNSFICYQEHIHPAVARQMSLSQDQLRTRSYTVGVLRGIDDRIRSMGQLSTVSGIGRYLQLSQPRTPDAQRLVTEYCSSSNDSVLLVINVLPNATGQPYRINWELRQRGVVERGSVERENPDRLLDRAYHHHINRYSAALVNEGIRLGPVIARHIRK